MSIRQSLVDAIATRLATVTGFDADHVHEWRRTAIPLGCLPAIVYADGADQVSGTAYGTIEHTLEVLLEVVATGATAVDDLRTHAENVLAGVASDPTWGDLATTTVLVGVDLDVDRSDRIVGAATIELAIKYETDRWNL